MFTVSVFFRITPLLGCFNKLCVGVGKLPPITTQEPEKAVIPHGIPEIRDMVADCPIIEDAAKLNLSDEKGSGSDLKEIKTVSHYARENKVSLTPRTGIFPKKCGTYAQNNLFRARFLFTHTEPKFGDSENLAYLLYYLKR